MKLGILSLLFLSSAAWAQLSKNSLFLEKKNHLTQDRGIALIDTACAQVKDVVSVRAKPFRVSDFSPKEFQNFINDPCLLGVENDQLVWSVQMNDPLRSQQKFLDAINFNWGHRLFLSPALDELKPVVVAVIDSGIDSHHPEFLGRFWRGASGEIGFNFMDNSVQVEDDFGHGTHVSGLIAANTGNGTGVAGVSAQAQLMVLKTQDRNGQGSVADLISAIRYATDQGAQVINISLSIGAESPGLQDALDYALERNVVVVTAAGNNASEITSTNFISPAGYAPARGGLISVGSVDGESGELSWFSNFSETHVEIAAPGSYGSSFILSTYRNQGYRALEGTSMASPIVAAGVAQLIAFLKMKDMAYNAAGVESLILAYAPQNSKLQGKIKNQRQFDFYRLGRALLKRYHLSTTGGFDD